eukprot:5662978-Pyramimonas_sp.AAC.1
MEGGWFSKRDSRVNAAHIRFAHVQEFRGLAATRFQNVVLALAPRPFVVRVTLMHEFHGSPSAAYQKSRFGEIRDYEGATVALVPRDEVPGTAFWHEPGSSKRNNHVDPWHWNPRNDVFANAKVFKRLCSNEAVPPLEIILVRGL